MNPKKIVLLIICCFFLSGCWDHNEPEQLLYINGIGIHYNENGDVEMYIQIINLQGLAKQESGGGPSTIKQAEVGRAVGKTMEEAAFNLYHTVDRHMFWGHLTYVVFSEDAVKKGAIEDIADFIDRFRETRYRTYFFMTKDSIKDILLVKSLDNIPLGFSKLSDPIDNYQQTSFIEPVNLRELILQADEPAHQIHLPVLKITEQWADEKKKQKNLLMEDMAFVANNTLIEIVPKKKYQGARIINKHFIRDLLVLHPGPNRHLSVVLYDKKTKISPVTEPDGKVRFNIKMDAKAVLQMSKYHMGRKEIEKEIKKEIKYEIHRTYNYTRKRDIDVLRLSEELYRKDNKKWKEIQKDGRIPLEEDTIKSITINVKLQNTGRNNINELFIEEENKGMKKRYK